ncbi:hypothetical protein [Bradyrhizobium sp. RT9a]|uniref:hypothetical protein n=1 Tax=Bradyrhizobium sp. RT9a TaxID=3156384 RepID=UPI00339B0115
MISLTLNTRRISRAAWRAIWRQQRIINRETRRAQNDLMLFGTAFVQVGADIPDFVRAVRPWDVIIRPDGTPELRP